MDNYNTTLEFCVNNISNGKSLFISNITLHICGFICIIIGLPGHIFHFIALLIKTNRNDPNTLYLIATMICDLIFVIDFLWLYGAQMSLIKYDPREIFSCGIYYSIFIGSTTLLTLYVTLW
ncbi:unnamed protein product [Rotaria socialis]|uniref:Uncharacterized protein n=2 Tax=Rotaria socialis TaxID=392032 RepID=A0A817Y4T1_9BILA|nr:unnamed protein product [Rotaria socialis]